MSERDRELLRMWLEEADSDSESVLGVEDPDELEEDFVQETIEHSDTEDILGPEVEEEEDEDVDPVPEQPAVGGRYTDETSPFMHEFYIGRENRKKKEPSRWYLEPLVPRTSRTPNRNIIPAFHRPGPQGNAKSATNPLASLLCLIDDEMIQHIVFCTNIYIDKIRNRFSRDRDAKHTDDIEIKSLLGILYICGVLKSSRRNVFELWDNSHGTGCELVYVTMSEHRFRFLIRCLRFDDIRDREQRKALDKLAAIRLLFDKFVANSANAFKPSDYLTLDEQLVAFRGRCPFRQYMPKKPAKFGIKIYALVSSSNFYATRLEVYVGQQPEGPFHQSNKVNDLVCRLVEPIVGSNRNVTADNFFSSIPLTRILLQKSLTYLGTLKKNKVEIPECFLPNKDRELKSSIFGFQDKCTLVSYVPQKNKAVCAISTMHYSKAIDGDTGVEKKPCIITTYNQTKHGVDILDKMCRHFDVSRNSRRWPLTIFFHIMNVAGVNAINIYRANKNDETVCRRQFLKDLAFELVEPAIRRRIAMETLPKELRRRGKLLLRIPEEPPVPREQAGTVGKCFLCGRRRNKSTRKTCEKCQRWVCPDHQKSVCDDCYE